eukprot:scaffold17948_cov135-Isochrysis_galbana.AAC.1
MAMVRCSVGTDTPWLDCVRMTLRACGTGMSSVTAAITTPTISAPPLGRATGAHEPEMLLVIVAISGRTEPPTSLLRKRGHTWDFFWRAICAIFLVHVGTRGAWLAAMAPPVRTWMVLRLWVRRLRVGIPHSSPE